MGKALVTAISDVKTSGRGSQYKSIFFAGDDNGGKGYGCFDSQYSKMLTEAGKLAVGDEVDYMTNEGYLKKVRKLSGSTPVPAPGPALAATQSAPNAQPQRAGWVPDASKEIGILTSYCLDAMVDHKFSDMKQAVDLVFGIRALVEKRLTKPAKDDYSGAIDTLAIQLDMDPTSGVWKKFAGTYKSQLQLKLDLEAVVAEKKEFTSDPEGNLAIVVKE